jgi:hypothetical protein
MSETTDYLRELAPESPDWVHEQLAEEFEELHRQVRSAIVLLRKLEWSKTYSYCTGWPSCPVCGGIKPGCGYDNETGSYPNNSGHREDCKLSAAINRKKQ